MFVPSVYPATEEVVKKSTAQGEHVSHSTFKPFSFLDRSQFFLFLQNSDNLTMTQKLESTLFKIIKGAQGN